MNKVFATPLLLVSVIALVGCTPARYASDEAGGKNAERGEREHDEAPDPRLQDPSVIAAASRVRVMPDSLGCQSEVLGLVDVHEPVKSTAEGLEVLRRRAALLGAEAVVGVEFEHGEGGAEKTHLSGTAVRCNDLLRGRKYDVLDKIEVTAAMDHEDQAFAQLKSRARAKGANLILNVHFDHGEGDRTKITGTAVRAYGAEETTSLR
jgi:uncharacterized protein YbjQ (UPF0145 family)